MKKIVAIIIASVLGVAAIVTGIILIVHFAGSKSYKINFYEDPSKQILLQSQSYDEGATVTYDYEKNGTPKKASTTEFDYEFAGWEFGNEKYAKNAELPKASEDRDYIAYFKENAKAKDVYTIKFVDEDGTTVLATYQVEKGKLPAYDKATPTKASTAQYDYVFKNWTPSIVNATANATYKAVYEAVVREYTALFVDEDGTTTLYSHKYAYGTNPVYDGVEPSKTAYEFIGWSSGNSNYAVDDILPPITGDAKFVARYIQLQLSSNNTMVSDLKESTEANVLYEMTIVSIPVQEGESPKLEIKLDNQVLPIYVGGQLVENYVPLNGEYQAKIAVNESGAKYVELIEPEDVFELRVYAISAKKIDLVQDKYNKYLWIASNVELFASDQLGIRNFTRSSNVTITKSTAEGNVLTDDFRVLSSDKYNVKFDAKNNTLYVSYVNEPVVDTYSVNDNVMALSTEQPQGFTQYEKAMNVEKGQALTFKLNGTNINVTLEEGNNNAILDGNVVKIHNNAENVKIILKKNNTTGAYTVWGEGYDEDVVVHVYKVNQTEMADASTETNLDGWKQQYKAILSLTKDQELAFTLDGSTLTITAATGNLELANNKVVVKVAKEDAVIYLQIFENGDIKVYSEEVVIIPVYKVNATEMADASTEQNFDGWKHQYKATLDLTQGQELAFSLNGTALTITAASGNLEIADNKVVAKVAKEGAVIYLQIFENGDIKVYSEEVVVAPVYKVNTTEMTDASTEPNLNGWKHQYKATLDLTQGLELAFTLDGTALTITVASGNLEITNDKVVAKLANEGAVIYLQLFENGEIKVYSEEVIVLPVYKVNTVEMADASTEPNLNGWKHQYKATLDLTQGLELAFTLDGTALTITVASGNLEITNDKVVAKLANEGAIIYLQLFENGEIKVYSEEVVVAHVYKVNDVELTDASSEANLNGWKHQYKATLDLTQGLELAFSLNGTALTITAASGNLEIADNKVVAKLANEGAIIYLQLFENGEIKVYSEEVVIASVYKVNTTEMTDASTEPNLNGWKHQYKATLDLTQGLELTFTQNDEALDITVASGNLEITNDKVVAKLANEGAVVYLQIFENGEIKVYSEEVVIASVYKVNTTEMTDASTEPNLNGWKHQYKATLDLTAEQELAFTLNDEELEITAAFGNLEIAEGKVIVKLANEGAVVYLQIFENGEIKVYSEEVVIASVYKVNTTEMTDASSEPNLNGWKNQYKATLDLTQGLELTFTQNDEALDITVASGNLEITNDKVVAKVAKEDAVIYLQIFENGDIKVYSEEVVIIPVYKVNTTEMTDASTEQNLDGWKQQYKVTLDLTQGQELAFSLNGTALTITAASGNLEIADNKVVAKLANEGAVVYLQIFENGEIKVYSEEVVVAPVYKVNTTEMTDASSEPNLNSWKHQYKATLDLTAEQELTFTLNDEELGITAASGNLEIAEGKVIVKLANEGAVIYLQLFENGDVKVYSEEVVVAHVYKVNTTEMTDASGEPNLNGWKHQYKVTLDLTKAQELAFTLNDEALEITTASGNLEKAEGKVLVKLANEGAVIYLQIFENGEINVYSDEVVIIPVYKLNDVEMTDASTEDKMGDNWANQYTITLNLTEGLELVVELNDEALTINNLEGNLALVQEKIVVLCAKDDAKVYLKVYDNEGVKSYKLFAEGYEAVYYLNSDVMSLSEEQPQDFTQYELSLDLTKGQTLEFKLHYEALDVTIETGQGNNNAILDQDVIKVHNDVLAAKVYLKKNNSTGAYSVWVDGFADETHTYKIGDTVLEDASTETNLDGWKHQYKATLDLTRGSQIVVTVDGENLTINLLDGNVKLHNEKIVPICDAEGAEVYLKLYVNEGVYSYKLYAGGYQKTYDLDGTVMTDASSEDKAGDTWTKQYKLSSNLLKGQELTFNLDYEEITISDAKGNALLSNGNVLVHNNANDAFVYLKVYEANEATTYKVYVEGLEDIEEDFNTYYLYVNDEWAKDNAKVMLYVFVEENNQNTEKAWLELELYETNTSGKVYRTSVHHKYNYAIVVRFDPAEENPDWEHGLWNKTANINLSTNPGKDLIVLPDTVANVPAIKALEIYQLYTLTFVENDGSNVNDITAYPFETIVLPTPTLTGHNLVGWYESDDEGETLYNDKFEATMMPYRDATLYAKWQLKTCTITFVANGATNQDAYTKEIEVTYGDDMPTIPVLPVKENNSFLGYFDGEDHQYYSTDGSILIEKYLVDGNLTLTAKFTDNYVVTFNANGGLFAGDEEVITDTYEKGANADLVVPLQPKRDNYTFLGYKLNGEGNIVELPEKVTASATYVATWELNKYAIKFYDEDEETLLYEYQAEHGSTIVYGGEAPTKTEDADFTYTFKGWSDGEITYNELPQAMGPMTFFAEYEPTLKDHLKAYVGEVEKTLVATEVEPGNLYQFTLTTTLDNENCLVIKNNGVVISIIINQETKENYHPLNGTYKVYVKKVNNDLVAYLVEPDPLYKLVVTVVQATETYDLVKENTEWSSSSLKLASDSVLSILNYTTGLNVDITNEESQGNQVGQDLTITNLGYYRVYFKSNNNKLYVAKTGISVENYVHVYGVNGWEEANAIELPLENEVYSKVIFIPKNTAFKIVVDKDVNTKSFGYDFLDNQLKSNDLFAVSGNEKNLIVKMSGNYLVTFDATTATIELELQDSYTVKLGNGAATTMELAFAEMLDDTDAQFVLPITAVRDTQLTFNVDGVTPANANGNNVSDALKVISDVTAEKLYLKVKYEGQTPTYTLWLGGYHDMYYLGGTLFVADETEGDWTYQYKLNVSAEAGDEFVVTLFDEPLQFAKLLGNVELSQEKVLVRQTVQNQDLYLRVYVNNSEKTYKLFYEGYVEPEENYTTIYVYINEVWHTDGAKFAIALMDSSAEFADEFTYLTKVDNTEAEIYKARVHKSYHKIDILRVKNDFTGNDMSWDNKGYWFLNQSNDINNMDYANYNFIILNEGWDNNYNPAQTGFVLGNYQEYTLTFVENEGSDVDNITAYPFEAVLLPTPTRTGYTFDGWFESNDGGETLAQNSFNATVMPYRNVTLYAKWTVKTFEITLNAQGAGNEYTTTVTATFGQPMPNIAVLPVYATEGTSFAGYFFEEQGEDPVRYYNSDGTSAMNYDKDVAITLTASWSEDYVVVFKANGGTFANEKTTINQLYSREAPRVIELPASPTKTGYTFSHWSLEGETEAFDFNNYYVNSSNNFVANYTINQYQIKFVDEDGQTVLKAATAYDYNTAAGSIVKPATPTKAGNATTIYVFSGWTPEITTVTADATYKAVYTKFVVNSGSISNVSFNAGNDLATFDLTTTLSDTVLAFTKNEAAIDLHVNGEVNNNHTTLNGTYKGFITTGYDVYLTTPANVYKLHLGNNFYDLAYKSETKEWFIELLPLEADTNLANAFYNYTTGETLEVSAKSGDDNVVKDSFVISEIGDYTIYLTPSDNKVWVNKLQSTTVNEGVYIIGSFNNWAHDETKVTMTKNGNLYSKEILIDKNAQLKLFVDNDEIGLGFGVITEDTCNKLVGIIENAGNDGKGNIKFNLAGHYRLTFNSQTTSLIIELIDEFKVKVNNGEYALMTLSHEAMDANTEAQYEITLSAAANDKLTFTLNGEVIANIDANIDGNNAINDNADIKVRKSFENEKVYLKLCVDGNTITYELWVEGYESLYYVYIPSNWSADGATLAIYAFNDAIDRKEWHELEVLGSNTSGKIYTAKINDACDKLIVVRLKSSNLEFGNQDSNVHNKTADIVISAYNFIEIEDGKWGDYVYEHNYEQHTITFDEMGGTEVQDITKYPYEAIESPTTTKTNYTFANWVDGEENAYTFTVMGNSNLALKAKWNGNQYEIRYYDENGVAFSGSHGDDHPTKHTYGTQTNLAAATKVGYDFDGWYLDEECDGQKYMTLAADAYTSAINLYVKWTPRDDTAYTVNHYLQNLENDEYVLDHTDNKTGTTATLTAAVTLNQVGYTPKDFDQLVIAGDGSTVIDIYYNRNVYDVTFEVNGGSAVLNQKVKHGGKATNPNSTRSGYTVIWKNGNNVYNFDSTVTYSLELVATWNIITYSITYEEVNGAINTNPTTYDVTTATINLANLTGRTGYDFVEWKNGENTITSIPQGSTGDLTLTAIWLANEFTVTYLHANGTKLYEETVSYNEHPTFDATATTTNVGGYSYAFYGWNYNDGETIYKRGTELPVVTADITYKIMYDNIKAYVGENEATLVEVEHNGNDLHKYTLTLERDTTNVLTFKNNEETLTIKIGNADQDEYHPLNGTYAVYVNSSYDVYLVEPAYAYQLALKDGESVLETINLTQANANEVWLGDKEIAAGTTLTFKNYTTEANVEVTAKSGDNNIVKSTFTLAEAGRYNIYLNTSSSEVWVERIYTYYVHVNNWDKDSAKFALYTDNSNEDYRWTELTLDNDNDSEKVYKGDIVTAYTNLIVVRLNSTSNTPSWNNKWNETARINIQENLGKNLIVLPDELTNGAAEKALTTYKQYTITFNTNGGSEVASIVEYPFMDIEAPANPTKAGYTFVSWDEEIPTTMPYEDMTITASWNANNYTVTLNENYGVEPQTSNKQVTFGSAYGTLTTPSRTGYTFVGWFDEASEGNEVTAETIVATAENHTIYAHWSLNSYQVRFNANTGSGEMANEAFDYGETKALTNNAFTKTGYKFAGWATSANGAVAYANGASVTSLSAQNNAVVDLYAKWTAITYKVRFNANGGTGEMDDLTLTYDTPANLTANAFEKNLNTFASWNTLANGTGTTYQNGASVLNLSTTENDIVNLYAIWTNKLVVTFNANGGNYSGVNTIQKYYDENDPITSQELPSDPTRVGYNFTGYKLNDEGELITEFENSDKVTANRTYYAQWAPKNNTAYTVKHYKQNVNNNEYGILTDTDNLTGTTAANTNAQAKSYTGFTPQAFEQATIAADGSTVINIYYNRNTYALSWNLNGGSATNDYTEAGNIKFGATITAPVLTKTGYTYEWNQNVPATMPANAVAMVANWTANTYSVVFNGNGSTSGSMANQAFTYDTAANLTANAFAKTDYIFEGWNTDKNAEVALYENSEEVNNLVTENNGSITLYAIWSEDPYRTIYVYDAFGNWSADNDVLAIYCFGAGDPQWYSLGEPTDDHLFSVRILKTYTTVIVVRFPSGTESYIFENKHNQTVDVTLDGKNLIVLKALTEVDGSGNVYVDGPTLYKEYTITFDLAGAEGSIADITSLPFKTIVIPDNPTRDNYSFDEWYNGENPYTLTTLMPHYDLDLTAHWTGDVYNITYKDQGDVDFSGEHGQDHPTTHRYGTETALVSPTKTGYRFDGWFITSNCTGDALTALAATAYTANITLYAKWTLMSYDVTFYDGLTILQVNDNDTNTYGHGSTATKPANPTKEGTANVITYTFTGWNTAPNGAGEFIDKDADIVVTNEMNLYAVYSVTKYYTLTLGETTFTNPTEQDGTGNVEKEYLFKPGAVEANQTITVKYGLETLEIATYEGNASEGKIVTNDANSFIYVKKNNNETYSIYASILYELRGGMDDEDDTWKSSQGAFTHNNDGTYELTIELSAGYEFKALAVPTGEWIPASDNLVIASTGTYVIRIDGNRNITYGIETTLTLEVNSDWASDNARFAAYLFGGTGTSWVDLERVGETNTYTVTFLNRDATTVIFCRMNGATSENNWDNKWNQTGNLIISDGLNKKCVITGWDYSSEWQSL